MYVCTSRIPASVTMRLNYKLPKDSLCQERQRGFRHCAVPGPHSRGLYDFLPSLHNTLDL